MDLVKHGFDKGPEKGGRRMDIGAFFESHEGEFGSSVDRNEKTQFALGGLDLGNVDMEEANGIAFELASFWLVALDLRQPADAVTLQTALQG